MLADEKALLESFEVAEDVGFPFVDLLVAEDHQIDQKDQIG
jgi:hypothetical protein